MKRIEALQKIEDSINSLISKKAMAYAALLVMEEAGMTPPPYETGKLVCDPDFGMMPVIKREWEP